MAWLKRLPVPILRAMEGALVTTVLAVSRWREYLERTPEGRSLRRRFMRFSAAQLNAVAKLGPTREEARVILEIAEDFLAAGGLTPEEEAYHTETVGLLGV